MGEHISQARHGIRASDGQRAATVSFSKNCFPVILPATARNLREPPGADPHAGWCGGRGRKTPGYPIGRLLRIETALDYTTFLRHYSASIGTAVPFTTIPPVTGISTISRLGRPIASP